MPTPNQPIHELRVALTTRDYERLVKFYCDGLGMEPAAIWNNGEGHALVLDMGKATLEIFDEAQAETIDQIEAGKRVSGQIRFALQVDIPYFMSYYCPTLEINTAICGVWRYFYAIK